MFFTRFQLQIQSKHLIEADAKDSAKAHNKVEYVSSLRKKEGFELFLYFSKEYKALNFMGQCLFY